ncbi:pyridoxamine 5'-phosphate oxidase family protein [Ruania suaedae]|uniref:pyridoxine/pyridoxamine 5'-phosphate oxidase n=1 Tax=Ruania suaedae TaxID=2897774 RepID=UPI001E29C21F|nr:pyridoxamine 5'-phosphate oxidase family protein [Ruania suaedae]UFU02718.1 pyridoxamine 5'-phosphate oxidase family protein [Ruania suaedae]
MSLRTWLSELPALDRDALVAFDPDAAPENPAELFTDWLQLAADRGLPLPHALNLATATPGGEVGARTVILKDLTDGDWVIATDARSPKAEAVAANPLAALTAFWAPIGRQVRIGGPVRDLGDEAAAADFLERHPGARAATMTGVQSEPLESMETYDRAYAEARDAVEREPGRVPPTWRCYAIAATTVEFWAARPGGGQIRLRYALEGTWRRGLVWP